MNGDNPFAILGVSPEADNGTIRKAYHALAMQWHPDKNASPKAQEMFARIGQAYSILTDPEKRRQFLNSSNATRSHSANANRTRNSTEFDCLYNRFYGPKAAHHGRTDEAERLFCAAPQSPSGSGNDEGDAPDGSLDIHVSVHCSLEEMYNAAVKLLTIRRRKENGEFETKTIKITLVPGTEDHKTIRLPGQADRFVGNHRGDLIITIMQIPHARFARVGGDIFESVKLSLRDAISPGFMIESTGIDGEPIIYSIRRAVQPGEEIRVPRRGMRLEDGTRGDHVFQVSVAIPVLSEDQRRRLLEIL
jgi:DnaJ-class molecular chaperone